MANEHSDYSDKISDKLIFSAILSHECRTKLSRSEIVVS